MASKSQETYAETFQPHHQKPMFSLILLQTAATFSSRSRAAGAPRTPSLPHCLGILAGWPEAAKTTLAGSQTSRCHDSTVVRLRQSQLPSVMHESEFKHLDIDINDLGGKAITQGQIESCISSCDIFPLSCRLPTYLAPPQWLFSEYLHGCIPMADERVTILFLISSGLESRSSRLIVDVIIYITFCTTVVHQASWT